MPVLKWVLPRFLVFSLFWLTAVEVCAQDARPADKWWLEGRMHYGFIIPHHENMIHLTAQHLTMVEADLIQAANGRKFWEVQHHYPLKGITLLYSDLGGAPGLGKAVACMPYLNFNLTRGQRLNLYFRFGAGLGYLTRRFDRLDNYKNIAIGSHWNAAIQLMYELRWHVARRFDVSAGFSLLHFSNGAMRVPNLGINIATLNLGLALKLNAQEAVRKTPVDFENLSTTGSLTQRGWPQYDRRWQFSVYAFTGFSELYASGGPKFMAYTLSGVALKPVGKKGKRLVGPGIDLQYDEANIESMIRLGTPMQSNFMALRPGINVTHKLQFSHLSLMTQLGVYLYTAYKTDGYLYDRIALEYCFKKHYNLRLGIKTHMFTADMIEYGLGYTF